MRICIVCARLSFGGAERVAVSWANGFHYAGHEVMVISNLYDPITYQLADGILVRNLVSINQNKLKKWGSSFFNVRKQLKEFRPNVVVGVMATCSFVSKVASFGLGIPVIVTEHYSFDMEPFKKMSAIEYFCKFYLNRIYEHVTVLTKEDKRVIGNRLKHVSVMPNPLALHPVRLNPNVFNQRERIIVAAGRLDAWYYKGFDVLIKAWGKVVESRESRVLSVASLGESASRLERKGWRLQIAGTGSEESLEYLKNLCKENGVEDFVDFLGFVSDMESLYKKASVFVLSSRYEGFGLVLIEAMSQGCSCIACDHNGKQREIIQNEDQGLCTPPEDVEALATAMRKMMEDDEYRESVRGNAIERSKYYSIENTIARWEKLFIQVLRN